MLIAGKAVRAACGGVRLPLMRPSIALLDSRMEILNNLNYSPSTVP